MLLSGLLDGQVQKRELEERGNGIGIASECYGGWKIKSTLPL